MVGDSVFTLKGVSKKYGSREVLRNIDLEIRRGEILGLIGASGAGKTTLLNMLVGFIPSSRGEINFTVPTGKKNTYNVLNSQKILSKYYGFASQHPSFYEKLTVRENLHYFGAMYDVSPDVVEKNGEILLRLMGLKSHAHLLAQHLSGGMKRRLDIVCSLIHNPPILILDEPTADLDPVLRNHIWEVVKHIHSRGTTVILSSHHLNELDTLCDRIAIIKDGTLVDIDSPERLKHKYNKTQEIMIESFPGNYDAIIKKLKTNVITTVRREGTNLIIKTEQPESVISNLLSLLKRQNESLIDLQLVKPNLDNVFVSIYGDGKKKVSPPDIKSLEGSK